ncbi:MAG: hypothetical protein KAH06_09580, partial [Desulfobacterales bacterium]|nr:hypothetical protein [Desulfobacterales bacterium]
TQRTHRDFFFAAEKGGKEKTINRFAVFNKLPVRLDDYYFSSSQRKTIKKLTLCSLCAQA